MPRRPPRVLLDATAIPKHRGGVARYIEGLLQGLAELDATDRVVVAAQPRDVHGFVAVASDLTVIPAPSIVSRRPARLAWEQVGLPRLVRRVRADVVHSPHYTMPRFTSVPVVVTLHDATFFSHPQWHSRVKAGLFTSASRHAVRSAVRCVVPSAATRDELVRWTSGDPAQIDVIPHGVDQQLFVPPAMVDTERVARSLGVTANGYVAFLGTLEPRKNVPALIRAFVEVATASESPLSLVLAGGPGWDEDVEPALASVPRGVHVVRAGYLPVADLPGFLAGSLVVAYPSLGEGFGLPVLEAMACGACVLTTTRLSLPEVGGDAVAYTEPDASSIASSLSELVHDPGRRAELGRAALSRAERFTWRRAAEGHLATYEQASRTAP